MSKFKVGDEVVLVNSENNPSILKNGVTGVVLDNDNVPYVQFDVEKSNELNDASGLGENGKCWAVKESEIELIKTKSIPSFKTSNRYKLHKYISSTGFSKLDLSRALNKGDSFLSVETRESQFTNRGDMSDARYKSLRKQIKEVVQIKSITVGISVTNVEVSETLAEVEPKEETNHKKLELNINGQVFNFSPNESVSIEIPTKKPSNNGVSILELVFFVMLVIFILGCFIYKAA